MVRTAWETATTTGILMVTLDRPERRNAVDLATLLALLDALELAASARVLVLTGAPPAFSAGADLTGVEEGEFAAALGRVLRGLAGLPIPTVAAVDGPALGAGTQLAMACDVRVATAASRFGIPAARLGLVVDHWTVERLTREVGWPVAGRCWSPPRPTTRRRCTPQARSNASVTSTTRWRGRASWRGWLR